MNSIKSILNRVVGRSVSSTSKEFSNAVKQINAVNRPKTRTSGSVEMFITINSIGSKSIVVDFGNVYIKDPKVKFSENSYQKTDISKISKDKSGQFVELVLNMPDRIRKYKLTHEPFDGRFTVSAINGSMITSNDDLFNKLIALRE